MRLMIFRAPAVIDRTDHGPMRCSRRTRGARPHDEGDSRMHGLGRSDGPAAARRSSAPRGARHARLTPRRAPRARRVLAGIVALVTAASGLAHAATVYELEGAWSVGTPTTVATGDAVSASWWFNLNDDAAAPGNAPVDDVTITVTGQGAVFDSIPPVCLTDGVDPASSISDDGATLVCNVGTQDEGTAFALTTPMRVTAQTGEPVSAGATVADQEATVPDLVVQNAFFQD